MFLKSHNSRTSGFTLIETMVAISIFTIVVTIGLGALLQINGAYSKSRLTRSAMDNLNFALESMTREIRIGSTYHCGVGVLDVPADCAAPESTFTFEQFGGDSTTIDDQLTYALEMNGNTGRLISNSVRDGKGYLTSPDIDIESFQFYVSGSGKGDNLQPSALIILRGKVTSGKQSSEFTIQTTVSQRMLDA